MVFKSRCMLLPGPSREHPITLRLQNVVKDEDGSQAQVDITLTLDETEDVVRDLQKVCEWVKEGVWGPR